jgi:hypothetical protein
MMAATTSKPSPSGEGAALRSVASLLVFIHLFCVAVVLSSNFRRSRLQNDLVRVFAAYTRLLHFDPDFTPYFYTLGRTVDDDTWLVVDLYADADQPVTSQKLLKSVQFPPSGGDWLGQRRRYFRLASMLAASSDPETEDDDVSGAIARSVAARVMREAGARRAVVRCLRRMSQPFNLATLNPGFPPDRPTDPAYDQSLYEADVWIDEDGNPQVLKRASRAEVAPRQSPSRPSPENPKRLSP